MNFRDKEQLRGFIHRNTPFLMQGKRSKTKFVNVFSRSNSMDVVVDALTDAFWEEINKKK
jgi:hypothetical protein